MNIITNLFTSSLGKKFIMAITGMALFLFVAMHLLGNLQIFLGPEALNRYGHFLQSNPEIIWPARIGLLLMVALHIWSFSHGIASLFGRGDAGRRKLPMTAEELLEAGVLVYLRGLGFTDTPTVS